jgi:predicted transcriptional regulator
MPDFLIFVGGVHKILKRSLILDLHDLTPELFESKWSRDKGAVLVHWKTM